MTFQGHVENGMIILNEPIPLPDGTPVVVEAKSDAAPAHFWQSYSLDELAQRQGVPAPRSPDDLLGGWPPDEIDDNFEQELLTWRERELESHA